MIVLGSGETHYAVQVDKNKMVQHVTVYFTDEGLKNCWGICKAKRHHLILKVAIEALVNNAGAKGPILLAHEKEATAGGEEEGLIRPVTRELYSCMDSFRCDRLFRRLQGSKVILVLKWLRQI